MSENNGKRPYDEQTLAKVLEAAYVLQEHNRALDEQARQREKRAAAVSAGNKPAPVVDAPKPAVSAKTKARPPAAEDYAVVLAQIVETQHQIQLQQLDPEAAIAMIAERAAEIARADGAGVAIREGVNVRYTAASGSMALSIGTEVLMEKALCAACLRVGHVVRCADVNVEFLVDLDECRRRGIQAMIAAPLFVSGNVMGALELYYSASQAFVEQDVHTCQLMAGLVGEALARKMGVAPTKAGNEAKPETPIFDGDASVTMKVPLKNLATSVSQPAKVVGVCHKCGAEIVGDEQFCGTCGLPVGAPQAALAAECMLAAAPDVLAQETAELAAAARASSRQSALASFEAFTGPYSSKTEEPQEVNPEEGEQLLDAAPDSEHNAEHPAEGDAAVLVPNGHWNSAAAAREFLEKFASQSSRGALRRFLKARRGDIYLALALVLVAIVIRWGIWSGHPVNATGNPAAAAHRRPDADLPLYDRMLIKFGLAEAPDPPEYKGNPDTQVWIDVRTALYYCPGAELYGKTPKGKFSSQRDAQMDQYEPATRKACD